MFSSISWNCKSTWKKAKINTLWCLLGCSIGDFGTILFFQYTSYSLPVEQIMILAIINGLITSVILETAILAKQMKTSLNGEDYMKIALFLTRADCCTVDDTPPCKNNFKK